MSETKSNILVAVPYYGNLSLPPLGLSRLFFVATVDTRKKRIAAMEIQVWDPKKEPNLSIWMRSQGFSGVICSDSGSHYKAALNAESVWLIGNQEGEAIEVVERWMGGAPLESEESFRSLGSLLKSWVAPPERTILAV